MAVATQKLKYAYDVSGDGGAVKDDEFNDASIDSTWTTSTLSGGAFSEDSTHLNITCGAGTVVSNSTIFEFNGVYQNIPAGDFDIYTRMTTPAAAAGLRLGIVVGEVFSSLSNAVYKDNTLWSYRGQGAGGMYENGSGSISATTTNIYIRMSRSGSTMTSYVSSNASTWETIKTYTIYKSSAAGKFGVFYNCTGTATGADVKVDFVKDYGITASTQEIDINETTAGMTRKLPIQYSSGTGYIRLEPTDAAGVNQTRLRVYQNSSVWAVCSKLDPGIDTYTRVLFHGDGAHGSTSIGNESSYAFSVYPMGNVSVSTVAPKFGTGSIYFDGSGDYIYIPTSTHFCMDGVDFTIDLWMKVAALPGAYDALMSNRQGAGSYYGGISFFLDASGKPYFSFYDTSHTGYTVQSSVVISTGAWNHLAAVRYQNTLKLYVNGIAITQTQDLTGHSMFDTGAILSFGRDGAYADYYYTGYMDEPRISKGIARWTENFTPPTAAYSSV